MDTQHGYSLRQLCSRRKTKPCKGQGGTGSRSLEGLGIPAPDYHEEYQNQPNPPNRNNDIEEDSNARNIWGNAERYKGTISDKKGDQ